MMSFKLFGTPIKMKAIVFVVVAAVWGIVTALQLNWHPGRGLGQGLLIGFATMVLLIVVEFGHALAHIFSARYAGAPMDEIQLNGDMPRTLYWNNDVAPAVHRMRALGGPLFNLLGFLLSTAVYGVIAGHAIARELAAWSAAGHGLLFLMSLAPLPPVDGGSILKWTLVERGRSESAADAIVQRIDWMLGSAACIVGVILISLRLWTAGIVAVAIGVIVCGIASGHIQ